MSVFSREASPTPASLALKLFLGALLLSIFPLVLLLYGRYLKFRKPCSLPVLNLDGFQFEKAKQEYITRLDFYVRLGREQYPGLPFLLWGPEGYVVILPETLIHELENVDVSVANNEPLRRAVLSDVPDWFDRQSTRLFRPLIHQQLTPKLASLTPVISDEIEYALSNELHSSDDWSHVQIHPKVLRIMSSIAARIFVGPELSRREDWINACIYFTLDLFKAGQKMRALSYLGKKIATRFHTVFEMDRIHEWHQLSRRLLLPIITKRSNVRAKGFQSELPDDMITWVLEQNASHDYPMSFEKQADFQLVCTVPVIHSSAATTTNLIYDLAARPEYLDALREEIDGIWKESGGLDKTSLAKMVKLDSFLKESQRVHPTNELTFTREIAAKQGLDLSNGLHLPRGTCVAAPAHQIALDPKNYDQPDEFHGFRFADLRSASKEDAHKFQFATTNASNSMYFGRGRFDCPGRFVASAIIKAFAASLIREYDIRMVDGSEKRPDSLAFAGRMAPDPNVTIMVKKRAGSY